LCPAKEKKKVDSRWKYLGWNSIEREDLKRCQKERIHEYNEGDANPHCIGVRRSQDYGKRKKRRGHRL
jgi:hypothetical protein